MISPAGISNRLMAFFGDDWHKDVRLCYMMCFNIPEKTELFGIMNAIDGESIKFLTDSHVISDDDMGLMRRLARHSFDVRGYLRRFLESHEESGVDSWVIVSAPFFAASSTIFAVNHHILSLSPVGTGNTMSRRMDPVDNGVISSAPI